MMDLGKIFKQNLEQQNFDAAEKNWKVLEKRLDIELPVKKNNRKILWFLFPILGAFVIYFYAKPNAKSNVATNNYAVAPHEWAINISNPKHNASEKVIANNKVKFVSKSNLLTQNVAENIAERSTAITDKILQPKNVKLVDASTIFGNASKTNLTIASHSPSKRAKGNVAIQTSNHNILDNENLVKKVELSNAIDENLLAVTSISDCETKNDLNFVSIAIPAIKLITETQKLSTEHNLKSVAITDDYSKLSSPKNKFSIAVYVGAVYAGKKILNADNAHSDYINRRFKEEKNATTLTFGADVNYTYKHLIFTTGFNYHAQSENRNYSNKFYRELNVYDPYWEKITSNYWQQNTHSFTTSHVVTQVTNTTDTVSYYDVINGYYITSNVNSQNVVVTGTQTITHTSVDSVLVSKTDSVQKFKSAKHTAYIIDENQNNLSGKNTISYLEIPVMVGYQWQFKKLGIAIKSGIGLGILNQHKTFYLSNNVSSITEMKTENFNRIVYNYLFHLNVNYSLTNDWALLLEPNFRTNLNSATNASAHFYQKYWNVGGNIGLMYKF